MNKFGKAIDEEIRHVDNAIRFIKMVLCFRVEGVEEERHNDNMFARVYIERMLQGKRAELNQEHVRTAGHAGGRDEG